MKTCIKCGNNLDEDAKFCERCGAKCQEDKSDSLNREKSDDNNGSNGDGHNRKFHNKYSFVVGILLGGIIVGIVMTGIFSLYKSQNKEENMTTVNHDISVSDSKADEEKSEPIGQLEGEGFASSEEAVTAFLTGLKEHNMSAMKSTFAIETYAEHIDVNTLIERLGSYHNKIGWVPNDTEFALQCNILKREDNVLQELMNLYMTLIKCDVAVGENVGMTVPYKKEEMDLTDFVENLFPGNKNTLDITFDVNQTIPEDVNDDFLKLQEVYDKMYAHIQPDDLKPICVFLRVDDEEYLLYMDTVLYEDRWYIAELGGFLGSLCDIAVDNAGLTHANGELLID